MSKYAKIITVAQQKGGAGKTTLAAHLAVALSQKGNKVALIDVDPQGSLGSWYKVREGVFGEEYTGLHFKSLSGWKIENEIITLRRSFEYIVIDSPPHSETDMRSVIRSADLVLVPVQPSATDLWATKKTLEIINNARISYRLVLNRVTPNSRLAEEAIRELGVKNILQIGNRIAFATCIRVGKTVTEIQPKSVAAEEIKKMVHTMIKTLVAESSKAA